MAMPSGTAITAAIRKPPTTRQIVMPTSKPNFCVANRSQPDSSVCWGDARKTRGTAPLQVSRNHSATKPTKKATPSMMRRSRVTGASSFRRMRCRSADLQVRSCRCIDDEDADLEVRAPIRHELARSHAPLVQEAGVEQRIHVGRLRLDHADLQQQGGRLLV